MNDSAPQSVRSPNRRRWSLATVAALLIAAAIAAYLGTEIRDSGPNFYAPARTALVNAQQRLSEAYTRYSALLELLHNAHADLDAVLGELNKAARLDPRDRDEIQALARRLGELDDARRLDRMTIGQLQQGYRELSDELNALIERMERRPL